MSRTGETHQVPRWLMKHKTVVKPMSGHNEHQLKFFSKSTIAQSSICATIKRNVGFSIDANLYEKPRTALDNTRHGVCEPSKLRLLVKNFDTMLDQTKHRVHLCLCCICGLCGISQHLSSYILKLCCNLHGTHSILKCEWQIRTVTNTNFMYLKLTQG